MHNRLVHIPHKYYVFPELLSAPRTGATGAPLSYLFTAAQSPTLGDMQNGMQLPYVINELQSIFIACGYMDTCSPGIEGTEHSATYP